MTLEGIPQGYYVFETDRNGRIIKSTFQFHHEDIAESPPPIGKSIEQSVPNTSNQPKNQQIQPKPRFSR